LVEDRGRDLFPGWLRLPKVLALLARGVPTDTTKLYPQGSGIQPGVGGDSGAVQDSAMVVLLSFGKGRPGRALVARELRGRQP
jgi:hypothetical protein